jgi:hypothetical protein
MKNGAITRPWVLRACSRYGVRCESPAIEDINASGTFPLAISGGLSVPRQSRQWLFNQPFLIPKRKLENVARVFARAAADQQECLVRLIFTR